MTRRRRRGRPALAGLVLAGATAGASAQVPAPGRYDAELCIAAPLEAAPSCGSAELVVASARSARVRIADIVYRLQLRSSQLDVVAMHGAVQIDEFSADYEWKSGQLVFVDTDKRVRYEVRPKDRLRPSS